MTDADLYGHDVVYTPGLDFTLGRVRLADGRTVEAFLRPWEMRDPNPIPEVVLFPRLARALRRWTRRH